MVPLDCQQQKHDTDRIFVDSRCSAPRPPMAASLRALPLFPQTSQQLANEQEAGANQNTFLTEKELWATNTFHSTAHQAAQLARDAGAGKLLLGHFSARYKDLSPIQSEARKVFKNSYLALEGTKFSIKN